MKRALLTSMAAAVAVTGCGGGSTSNAKPTTQPAKPTTQPAPPATQPAPPSTSPAQPPIPTTPRKGKKRYVPQGY